MTVISLYICISYIYTNSYNFLLFIIFTFLLHVTCSVFDITPNYTFTIFLCFVILYLSLSFLALMHFYHVFIACSIYSLGMSIIYSCHITYAVHVIFLYIYYFHAYILYHLLCSILIYYYHVLFMYCVHVLISYIVFMYCTCSYTFRVIDTLLLVLVYLSSHSHAMLLISYHIFSHVIFKSFVLCFMSA